MAFDILETKNDYAILEESLTVPDPGGASEANVRSSDLDLDLSDGKFVIEVEITETSASNGALDAKVQGTINGSDYVDLDASLGLSLDTTGMNSAAALADLTDIESPVYAIQLFTDGTDIEDSIDVTVRVAVPNPNK